MSFLIKEGNSYNIPKRLYLCDTVTDFQNIPANISPYSEAIILTNPIARKVKKIDGTWVDIPTNSGGGSTDFTEPITVLTPTSDYNPATKKYVDDAIGDITEIDYQVVSSLPVTGTKGVIYLINNSTGVNDNYDEYLWVGQAFEKIGNTTVDLSGYIPRVNGVAGEVPLFDADGTLRSTGYTLGKSVPNDAVFTDTTYTNATQSQAGLMSSSDKLKIDELDNTYINKSEYVFLKDFHINVDNIDYVGVIKVIDDVPVFEYEMGGN